MGHYHSKVPRSRHDDNSFHDQSSYDMKQDDSFTHSSISRGMGRSKSPNTMVSRENTMRNPSDHSQALDPYAQRSKEDTSFEKASQHDTKPARNHEDVLYCRHVKNANQALQFAEDLHYLKGETLNASLVNNGPRLGYNTQLINEHYPLGWGKHMGRMTFADSTAAFCQEFKAMFENHDRAHKKIRIEELAKNPKFKGDPQKLKLEYLNLFESRKMYTSKPTTHFVSQTDNHQYQEEEELYEPVTKTSHLKISTSSSHTQKPLERSHTPKENLRSTQKESMTKTSTSPSTKISNMEKEKHSKDMGITKKESLQQTSKIASTPIQTSANNSKNSTMIARNTSSQSQTQKAEPKISPRFKNEPVQPTSPYNRKRSTSPNVIKVDLQSGKNTGKSPIRQGVEQDPRSARIEYKPYWKEAVRPRPGSKSPKPGERMPLKNESVKEKESVESLAKSLKPAKCYFFQESPSKRKPDIDPEGLYMNDKSESSSNKYYSTATHQQQGPGSRNELKPQSNYYDEKQVKYNKKKEEEYSSKHSSRNPSKQDQELSLGSFSENKSSGIEAYGYDHEDVEPIETSIDLSSYLLNNPKGVGTQNNKNTQHQVQEMGGRKQEQERMQPRTEMRGQHPERDEVRRDEGYRGNDSRNAKDYGGYAVKINNQNRGADEEDGFDDQEFINGIREKLRGLSDKMEHSYSDRPKDYSREEEDRHEEYKQQHYQKNDGNKPNKPKGQYNFEDSLRPDAYRNTGGNNKQQEVPLNNFIGTNLKVSSKKMTSRTSEA